MDKKLTAAALAAQRREVTEHHVYMRLSKLCKDANNAEVLRSLSEAEKGHALYWQKITGMELKPFRLKIFWNILKARLLGLTFTLKQMEKNEGSASKNYMMLAKGIPEAADIAREETEHEKKLLGMLDEELLQFVGSVVLGLNDALMELTGVLAGFTLALGSTKLISMAGLVAGISASLSGAAANYLSRRAENDPRAAKSALYTGITYVSTVALLIMPFLLIQNKFIALVSTLAVAVLLIMLFNYYLATARDLDFKHRFLEMTIISLGVAALSFGVGYIMSRLLGVDV